MTRHEGGNITFECAAEVHGCGAVHEADAGALAPVHDHEGTVIGARYTCEACGDSALIPRLTRADVARIFRDRGVAHTRLVWHMVRDFDVDLGPDDAAWLRAPIPPGDHSRNVAEMFEYLDTIGWPDVPDDRRRRHKEVLDRWPVVG